MATIIMSANCCDCEGIVNPCDPCAPPVGCCMYPAAGLLNGGYTEADLPDEIYLYYRIAGRVSEGIMTKSGSAYVIDPSLGEVTRSTEFGPFWRTTGLFYETGDFLDFTDNCLINASYPYEIPEEGDLQAAYSVQDTFADTYSFTLVFNGNTIDSGTITRIGLCVWSNTNIVNQIDGALFTGVAYSDATNGFGDLGVPLAWATYDGNEVKATKTPPHNSPEGTYPVFGGLYDGAVATVFQ
jgi:hypothetical protein